MSRVTLKPAISKLREIIIKNIAGKMEKYGFDDTGRVVSNKPLSEYDNVIKNNLLTYLKVKISRVIKGIHCIYSRQCKNFSSYFDLL